VSSADSIQPLRQRREDLLCRGTVEGDLIYEQAERGRIRRASAAFLAALRAQERKGQGHGR
jgi:hypothetical protein